jgi:hypothetical protein
VYETRRRQDEIKVAEAYRMAKNDPLANPAAPKAHQRLIMALGTKMVQWGTKLLALSGDLVTAASEKAPIEQIGNS